MKSTMRTITAGVALAALFVAGCGSVSDKISEKAAEQVTEKLIEAGAGEDVNVDISGEGDDMSIKLETDEGSMSFGAGAELPEGLEIPVPDGGEVQTALVADEAVSVSVAYDRGRFDELVAFYDKWTSGTGDDWESTNTSMEGDDGTFHSHMWSDPGGNNLVTVSDCARVGGEAEFDAACVSIIQGG